MRVEGGRLVRRTARVSHANARVTWTEREGVVLELRAGSVTGRGEASPLPGYSLDDLATSCAELESCWERLPRIDVDAPIRETFREIALHAGVRAPAAVFGLETAVLDLVSKARGRPAWAVLRGDDQASSIPLSALAEGADADALATSAERALARGIRVVKVKVGGADCARRDPPRLAAIRARVGDALALRLDANQSLGAEDLGGALDALSTCGPELIEEPAVPGVLSKIRDTPIPFALDESLMQDGWRKRITAAAEAGIYTAVVLKPMTLGGFERCLAIAEAANDARLAVIVTHAFDGPIASAAAACLALAVRGKVLPCGLDTHGRFPDALAAIGIAQITPFSAEGLGVGDLT